MPKYAVDFLAEIQELTSATNFDDCSDSVDLLTNLNFFNVPVERPSEENNVVNALMGNAQCCFRRYPGYQAHRHVVVSRGVQCSEAIIKKLTENDRDSTDNHKLFRSHTSERGDIFSDSLYKEEIKSPDDESVIPVKVNLNPSKNKGIYKPKPEIFTPVTQEPPELRESSSFFRKHFPLDYKKNRKYFEDDIDSLSATISNYSLHEKMLKLGDNVNCHKVIELLDQNNHKFNNEYNMTPVSNHRECDFRGSTEAMKGSMTRSLTGKFQILSQNKGDNHENQSSDSCTSIVNVKELKSTFMTNSCDFTQETNGEAIEKKKNLSHVNISNLHDKGSNLIQQTSGNLIQSFQQPLQSGKLKSSCTSLDKNIENNPCLSEKLNKSNTESRCTASVTFMKGSEELRKYEQQKVLECDNLNALRKKQRFIMKHTRTNSKGNISNNGDVPLLIVQDSTPQGNSDKMENTINRCQQPPQFSPAPVELPVPKSPRNNIINPSSFDQGRNTNLSRNSSHSDNLCVTPSPNIQKMKRSVSFDRNKQIDKSTNEQAVNMSETPNPPCSRNTVRAKYCTRKIIKQKFYVAESANIEQILRDPSDRRIKAICDRHNCDIEIYSKVPKCGFLKNIIILAAPNNENLRKCVRSLDYSMHWCLAAQLS